MDEATFSRYAMEMRRAAEISARSVGCTAVVAEDVASDVMLSLWMMRDKLDQATCKAYARTAGKHKALNTLRDSGRVFTDIDAVSDYTQSVLLESSPEDRLITQENEAWLIRQIDSLPSTQQAILKIRQVEMLEKKEIALRLGITETSVATLLSRARKTMYNAIKERMKR